VLIGLAFQLTQHKLVAMVLEIQKGMLVALHTGRLKDAGRLRPEQIRFGKARQRPHRHRHLPPSPNHPRRQRHHPRPLAPASRQQPRQRAHLRGHDEIHTLIMVRAITGMPAFEVRS
jgi:glutaryl-CoA dehydrogenase